MRLNSRWIDSTRQRFDLIRQTNLKAENLIILAQQQARQRNAEYKITAPSCGYSMLSAADTVSRTPWPTRRDMKANSIFLTATLALATMTASADWQWVEADTAADVPQESEAVWAKDDCELISEAAGAYLYHSGEFVKKSKATDEKEKKAALFKAGVALSQLSVNHAEVYDVFCKE